MSKPLVVQLFRKPTQFFSIERVFGRLQPALASMIGLGRWTAPRAGFSIGSILANIRSARACPADLYHITGDIHYLTLGLPRKRTMLTIHDCIFLYQNRGLKRRLLKALLLDLPVRHCALITTISESTRRDILRHTGCPPEKVVVIPNPVDEHIYHRPRNFSMTNPVLLFVGNTPNKNLMRVIPALEGIPCRLRIIGSVNPEQDGLLKRYRIDYECLSGLSDTALAAQYEEADIVLFPSTFEGFGLPVVEGQKAGRPVITSNLDPMKEVAGGAAHLVDPFASDSIRAGVLKLMEDAPYRDELIEKGFKNVERFDSQQIAKQYLACYNRLL